jgi:hypothetical protein
MMSTAPDAISTTAPEHSTRLRLLALAASLRASFVEARQAIDRMSRLIEEARLDRPDE